MSNYSTKNVNKAQIIVIIIIALLLILITYKTLSDFINSGGSKEIQFFPSTSTPVQASSPPPSSSYSYSSSAAASNHSSRQNAKSMSPDRMFTVQLLPLYMDYKSYLEYKNTYLARMSSVGARYLNGVHTQQYQQFMQDVKAIIHTQTNAGMQKIRHDLAYVSITDDMRDAHSALLTRVEQELGNNTFVMLENVDHEFSVLMQKYNVDERTVQLQIQDHVQYLINISNVQAQESLNKYAATPVQLY